jgi:hypothetical protein
MALIMDISHRGSVQDLISRVCVLLSVRPVELDLTTFDSYPAILLPLLPVQFRVVYRPCMLHMDIYSTRRYRTGLTEISTLLK